MTATRYDGTEARRSAATTNTPSATAIDAYSRTRAASRDTPAWNAIAPGVTLCGVAIGSETRPSRVRKSVQACTPATRVATTASATRTTTPAITADHRRVRNAH